MLGFGGRLLIIQAASEDGNGDQQLWPELGGSTRRYESVAAALADARDGDTLRLLPGTHVVSQACLIVRHRLLVEGIGADRSQVVIDHRGNVPAFELTRTCVLRNLTVDMVGFVEAINIVSDTSIKPVLRNLHIQCSGDDAVRVSGAAQPLLHDCTLQARRCALSQHGSASTTLWHCQLTGERHGLLVMEQSRAYLEHTMAADCGQDGVVALQRGFVSLLHGGVVGCGGPALDLSDSASAILRHTELRGCAGGVWLWQSSSCEAVCSHINGGSSYAVLLDNEAFARGTGNTIDGPCHDTSDGNGDLEAALRVRHARLRRAASAGSSMSGCWGTTGAAGVGDAVCCSPWSSGSHSDVSDSDTMVPLAPLVSTGRRPHEPAAAAALFPPEVGAFAPQPPALF